MANDVTNIVVEPVDAIFGAQHRVKVTCVADSAGDLGGTSFHFSTPDDDFYIWLDTGADTDPAPAGRTAIEVTYTANDTAATIAGLIATAVNAVAATNDFHAKATGDYVILEAKLMGAPNAAAADVDSGFTIAVQKAGFSLELGYLDGDVEVGMDEQLFDITAHQTGTQLLGQLRTGVTAGPISLTLKEAIAAKLQALIQKGIGAEYTPSGGSAVTAVGALAGSKQFQNVTADGGKLVLHPTKNAATAYGDDLCFWLAYPNLNAVTFSGESNKTVSIDFAIYLDQSRVNEGSLFVYGDHTQNFLK